MGEHVYGILGGGEVSTKFLTDTLASLRDKATADDEANFWLILPYELEDNALTDAFADVLEWVKAEEVWTRVYSAVDEPEEEQPEVDEFNFLKKERGKKVDTPAQAVVKDLVEVGGELLVITHTVDWDEPDKRDDDLIQAIKAANQNGVPVRQLNNGLMELDLTEEAAESDEDGPSEEDVRQMGVDADGGDQDAATALEDLGKEYEIDVTEEPYASMSWVEFAEAILAADAEKANAEVEEVDADKRPQPHNRAELERKQLRSLRSLAIAEGWGKADQLFPKWFLVEHLANGTVPTDEELADPSSVPTEPEGARSTKGTSKRAPRAESNGEVGDPVTRALLAQVLRELAEAIDPA